MINLKEQSQYDQERAVFLKECEAELGMPVESLDDSWKVDSDVKAEWVLGKIRESEAEFKRMEMIANAQLEAIQKKLKEVKLKRDNAVNFWKGMLQQYYKTLPKESLKATKTLRKYPLLTGELREKLQSPEIKKEAEELMKWAKETNKAKYVKTEVVETLLWGELKGDLIFDESKGVAVHKETGGVVRGIKVVPKESVFEIKA